MKYSFDTKFSHNISTGILYFSTFGKLLISMLDKQISNFAKYTSVKSCSTKNSTVGVLYFCVKAAVKP